MTQPLMEHIGARRTGIHRGGIQQKYILDEQGRRLLLERYDGKTETTDDLMRYFAPRGIPRSKVKKWASALGLARKKEPLWTEREIAFLERHLHKKSLGDIARELGRTKVAVKLKAKRLGMNKTQEGYTMRGLCLALGCDHHKVEKWLSLGWLKGKRRQSERTMQQGGDMWLFTDKAIRQLIRNHPNEIDPRRMDWLWVVDLLAGGDNGIGAFMSEREISA